MAEPTPEIKFDYIKTNNYREIYISGIYGGITPRKLMQMSIFTERMPIPNQISHETLNGALGNEISDKRVIRDAYIRSVEATLLMDLDTAKSIYDWIGKHLENAGIQLKNEEKH